MAKGKGFTFTNEMDSWLKANFNRFDNNEDLRTLFSFFFDADIKETSFRTHLYQLGLKRQEQMRFPDEAFQFLCDNYKRMGNIEMARLFNDWFPKKKGWTRKHIEKKMLQSGLERTKEDRQRIIDNHTKAGVYKEGNKKMWQTRGITPKGVVRQWWHNGKLTKYIKTDNGFERLSRFNYRKYKGEIPEGYNVFILDDDQMNCDPDNLILVKNSEQAYITWNPKEVRLTALKAGRLKQKIKQLEKQE